MDNQTNGMNQSMGTPQYMQKDPMEVKKWNWGAFAFGIWWGIGNRCYLPLLNLVPVLNLVWPFICGAKGNEWAYMADNYSSAAEFKRIQESWNRAGFVAFIVALALIAFYIIIFIFIGVAALNSPNPYSSY